MMARAEAFPGGSEGGELGADRGGLDLEQARVGRGAVGVAAAAGPQDAMARALRRRSPLGRRCRAEQDDRRHAQRGREVRDAGVGACDASGAGDEPGERAEVTAGANPIVRQAGGLRNRARRLLLPRPGAQQDVAARRALGAGDRGPPLDRPAPCGRRRAGVQERRAVAARAGRGVQVECRRIGRDAGLVEQPAPARDLVLALAPVRPAGHPERDQPAGPRAPQQRRALRPAAVQVHRDVGAVRLRRKRGRHRGAALDVDDPVDRAVEQRRERLEPRGREQQPPVVRERRREGAQRRHRGEEVAEPERAEHDEPAGHGQDGSVGTAITSSRSSTSGGRLSANTTPAAISPGGASFASGGGLYCSVRPSKNAVCMPPGISSVTPTRPAVSAASARVKPTTPNFEAQYAVASLTALRPSVEATVTTRPPVRSRCGSAARTTAAVPSRFTTTTRSQVSAGTSSRRPQASVPAAVTTPRSPPPASATRSTTASAARVAARSTPSNAKRLGGGWTSSTPGAPPAASTAAATAAPRPDAPPVTITVP